MENISLSGATHKTHKVEQNKQMQHLIVTGVSIDATIRTDLAVYNESSKKTIPTMSVVTLLEGQNKIDAFLGRGKKVFYLQEAQDSDKNPQVVVKQAVIDVCWDGELVLGEKDTYDITLKNLNKVTTTTLQTWESRKTGSHHYIVKEQTFESKHTDLNVDLSGVDFIILEKDKIPETVEIIQNNEKVKYTREMLLMQQEDQFGVVAYDQRLNPLFGTYKAVVIPVTNAKSVYFEDETNGRPNYKFYVVKAPLQ